MEYNTTLNLGLKKISGHNDIIPYSQTASVLVHSARPEHGGTMAPTFT